MAAHKGARRGRNGGDGDAKASVAAEPAPMTEPSADANVDKIREIIFGGQMQDYELRFAALEGRLASASAELREETRARLDALEAYITKEVGALGDRLATERRERTEAIGAAAADAAAVSSAIELRVEALDERTSADASELRDQLLQQSKALGDDLGRAQRALTERIEETSRTLRATTTDRQALAGLLADMAMRLSDPDAPEAGAP